MRGCWSRCCCDCCRHAAQAQTFPSRPITLIVPFPPGGSTDRRAASWRADAQPLGQPIVIENVGGAGGSIGVGRVARAAPDGYTFDIGQWDTHVGSIIYKLDYDLEKDFEPIALISNNPQLMVAKNDLPAKTLGELVTWMKANPARSISSTRTRRPTSPACCSRT
jgi:tripartite-type tricarboxylate transporter receptor subunit TctC